MTDLLPATSKRPPKIIAYDLSKLDDQAFHEIRLQGIGGSDAGKVMGQSTYGTPWEVYHSKRGDLPRKEQTEPMYWGTVLEPVIANRWGQDHPESTLDNVDALFQHHEFPWMLATPDRLVDDDGVLEIKTASHWVADQWEDGNVPNDYAIQGQHYCEVLDRDWCEFAVLIGGSDYRTHRFERDERIGQLIIERCGQFWQQVQDGTPPQSSSSDRVVDLYPSHITGEILPVSFDERAAIDRAKAIDEEIKQLKDQRDHELNVLRDAMGQAETAMDGDQVVATWKNNKPKADGTPGARVLRLK